jgi:hypothetical protein
LLCAAAVNAPVAKGSCLLVFGASVLSMSLKVAKKLDMRKYQTEPDAADKA